MSLARPQNAAEFRQGLLMAAHRRRSIPMPVSTLPPALDAELTALAETLRADGTLDELTEWEDAVARQWTDSRSDSYLGPGGTEREGYRRGRTGELSDDGWAALLADYERRRAAGELVDNLRSDLARQYGVSQAAIERRTAKATPHLRGLSRITPERVDAIRAMYRQLISEQPHARRDDIRDMVVERLGESLAAVRRYTWMGL